jgi:hypothetical protein
MPPPAGESLKINSPTDGSTLLVATFNVTGTVSPGDATVTGSVGGNPPQPSQVQASGGSFTLRYFQVPDGADYSCAANIVGKTTGDNITISVQTNI